MIKKSRKIAYAWLASLLIVCVAPAVKTYAGQATSHTMTFNEDKEFVRTQDAYLPDRTITTLGLKNAEEMFIDDNNVMYIADTGNKRIILYDTVNNLVLSVIKDKAFKAPRGVFVTKDGMIYVADSAAKAVLVFDKEHNLVRTIGKPDTPLFADTNYEPKRVAVDDGGNIFIVGEGVYTGIIQLASTGEFLGYFAVNDANLSVSEKLQRVFLTREQQAKLMDKDPTVFTNVFVDKSGIVYSVTSGLSPNGMKKHSTNGGSMFVEEVWTSNVLCDVYVNDDGLIACCSNDGFIDVYSKNGELIFGFGSMDVSIGDVAGIFDKLSAVAFDNTGIIWCLDSSKGYLQSFKPTDYALLVYDAMNLYESGYYEEAMEKWNAVLKLNQMSVLAHNGVGKAYLHAEDYENAMVHFEVANNKSLYSEAYWEVRNRKIQKSLGTVLIIIVILIVAGAVIKKADKKHGRIPAIKKKVADFCDSKPVLRDFRLSFKVTKRPMDLYYEVKKDRAGTVSGATVHYILFFVIYLIYQTSKGFIYQMQDLEDMDMTAIVAGFFAILFLFVIGNYLVTSITDGDGTLRQVYLIPAYALVPISTAMLAVTVVSHVLTYNESFLLTIIMLVGSVWSIVLVFVGLMTVHDYTVKETIRSFIITVAFMVIFAIVLIIISIMWESLYSFLVSVGKEVLFR